MPERIIWPILVVLDSTSRFLYTASLKLVNPTELKQAFITLFKQKMPLFPVLRFDGDPSLKKIDPFFQAKHMLLRFKRGPYKLGLIEPKIKLLKHKLIKHLRMHPEDFSEGRRAAILKEATFSINNTFSKRLTMTPSEANNPMLDPYLRKVLYPNHHIEPFEKFLVEQLRLQKKLSLPASRSKGNLSAHDFRIGDIVTVAYGDKGKIKSGYDLQRGGPFLEVARINTVTKPFIYQLRRLHDDQTLPGW